MKERPILFSGAMVRAILDGRKTQTRRVCRVQPEPWKAHWLEYGASPGDWTPVQCDDGTWELVSGAAATSVPGFGRCPYGVPGDWLWVRETWAHDAPTLEKCRLFKVKANALGREGACGPYYQATESFPGSLRWRPSIHMPRWASRITLEVTGVRCERLQSITAIDTVREGVIDPTHRWDGNAAYPRRMFRDLWDSINAIRGVGWASNPWVWVVEFRRLESGEA